MNYAKIKNNIIIEYPYGFNQLQADNPYTMYPNMDVAYWFPLTNAATEGYVLVDILPSPQPSYDWITQGIKETTPELTSGQWYQTWEIYQLTPEEISANKQQVAQDNKTQASTLLSQTDWTTIPDVSDPVKSNPYLMNQAEFISWRNQVRTIAINPPTTIVVFPIQPTEQWSS